MTDKKQTARNFHNYKVWQDAVTFATLVYQVTSQLPWFEKKGLCDQLQRAVVSISSNIAEGSARSTDADFARFLDQALGSANEVETQLLTPCGDKFLKPKKAVCGSFQRIQMLQFQRKLTRYVARNTVSHMLSEL